MVTVRIEHSVRDFEGWKRAFDSDPAGRENAKVVRYRVLRAIDEPSYVMIDLDFDHADDAEKFLERMREVWGRVEGKVIDKARARVAELVESKEYPRTA
jgi:hypothetical protein